MRGHYARGGEADASGSRAIRLECFGIDIGCRSGIATQRVWRNSRFIDDERKARDIKIRGQC
jgi:hypothetical protein